MPNNHHEPDSWRYGVVFVDDYGQPPLCRSCHDDYPDGDDGLCGECRAEREHEKQLLSDFYGSR